MFNTLLNVIVKNVFLRFNAEANDSECCTKIQNSC